MPTIERFSPFVKFTKWRKSRRNKENQRPRSIVTDVIRNVGLDSTYYSFEDDLNNGGPIIVSEKPPKLPKSRSKNSVLSLMCGLSSTELDSGDKRRQQKYPEVHSNSTVKPHYSETNDVDVPKPKTAKESSADKRKSWMSFMCGVDNLDFDIQKESSAPFTKTSPVEEHRKSWMSLVCGVGKVKPADMPIRYRDSGISLLSEENYSPMSRQMKTKSRSCGDILDNFREADESKDSAIGESFDCGSPSMNNLFRTTSIQESAFKITHRRRKNLKRRRGNECFSFCSERDLPAILKSCKSEGDLLNIDSVGNKDVRFSGNFEDFKERSVSSADVNRFASRQLKPWQIRRQTRDQKNKLKRESRNLELMLSKEFEFEERLIE